MIELQPVSFAGCPPLAPVPIFTGFARMVLDGVSEGWVWAQGRTVHALHGYGMSLVWGEDADHCFAEVIAHLNGGAYRKRDEWLQIDPRWSHLDWDGTLKAERYTRVNFRFDRTAFEARHGAPVLPPGWSIRSMRAGEFDLPGVAVTPCAFWRSFADCEAHGGGMCAQKDGEPGAVAFASTRADGWLEIGIETLSPYRGMGLARAVAVAMIHKCLADGLEPVWACRKENTGSLMLAQSLGFAITKEIPFYRFPSVARQA